MFLSYSDMLTSFDKKQQPGIGPWAAAIWSANEFVSDFICPKGNTNHLSNVIRHNWRYPASAVCVSWGCAAAGRAQWMTPSPATCRCTIDSDAKTEQILIITTSRAKVPFTIRTLSSYSTTVAIEETSVPPEVTLMIYFLRERHCFLSAYVTETSGYSTRHHELNEELTKNRRACDRGT